jgi:DNA-binding NarL/FixJ family response regulator
MKKVSILLVDDHPVVRQGLSALLKTQADLEVIEEADNGRAAVALAQKTLPDVIIMDVSMPLLNGAEATRLIRKTIPSAKILVLSSYDDDEFVEHLIQAGAAGYLTKEKAPGDLFQAIRAVHSGRTFFSAAITKRLRHQHTKSTPPGEPSKRSAELTCRQVEVLQLIAEGFATKQIAAELGISVKTAEKHRQLLMQRLNLHEIAGLTRYAISKGFVECKSVAEVWSRTSARDHAGLKPQVQRDNGQVIGGVGRLPVRSEHKSEDSNW